MFPFLAFQQLIHLLCLYYLVLVFIPAFVFYPFRFASFRFVWIISRKSVCCSSDKANLSIVCVCVFSLLSLVRFASHTKHNMSYEQENHVDRNCECNSHQLNDTRVTEIHCEWVDMFFFPQKTRNKSSLFLSMFVCLALFLLSFFPFLLSFINRFTIIPLARKTNRDIYTSD